MARSGRRPGSGDTRAEVLVAAREQFATRGYAGATIRAIAASAGVDPALVHHYFGSKRQLFVTAVELPLDPAALTAAALDGDPQRAGERLLDALLGSWETEQGSILVRSMLRSAVSDPDLIGVLRDFMLETVGEPVTAQVSPDRHDLRATLLASQVIGLAMARHVIEIEPLASADRATVVAAVAPNLQRYLTGELSEA